MTMDNSSYILPVLEATSEVPSTSIPARPVALPGSARQSGKKKAGAKSREEVFWAPTSPHPGKYEYINIGSRRDEKTADSAELTELLKLAEMYTSRSYVLNCELYKLLEMTFDELRSTTGEMRMLKRVENKDLQEQLVFSEDARACATYDVIKARTIQRVCVNAQKTAESQLKSCQNMIYAKDKKLTEALNELSKAQGLLAKLGVPGYAELLAQITRDVGILHFFNGVVFWF
ncbi:hypothetical protein Fot_22378 [Forsythia ovata]|uniref:Uncharacterized protein n=1 Tax=Forsythia ovata TaxID=205694 RepID=A0ABD1UXU5_9LAMI